MQFSASLLKGQFVKRYKRFLVDFTQDNQRLIAHTPNTGSMRGCLREGMDCYFSFTDNPKRKLKYTLYLVKPQEHFIGVHTGLANALGEELFLLRPLKHWQAFSHIRREVKISEKSRIDLVLGKDATFLKSWKFTDTITAAQKKSLHFIEIKNVTLVEGDRAYFPDAVTVRGQKHLQELISLRTQGFTAEIFFCVQMSHCKTFAPAQTIDPEYSRLLSQAQKAGVKLTAVGSNLSPAEIVLDPKKEMEILLHD